VQGFFSSAFPGALKLVAVQSLMLSLGSVLGPAAAWLFNIGHRSIRLPLFVIRLGGPWSIRVARLLVLLRLPCLEGCLFHQGVLVGDDQHLL
jgi:hypothetical protein